MIKPKLVVVTGYRTNTLRQMLSHYKDIVSEIHLVNYYSTDRDNRESYNRAEEIGKEFGCIIHERKGEIFNWDSVTRYYNEIKRLYPNDWWIVSDDDELQLYWDDIGSIIEECEINGWEFVTGGFIDKIGENGEFPYVFEDTNLWEAFPISSFFRYPMSGACPNKVTLCKGKIDVTSGQHYAEINGQTTWRWNGWNHPLRYPIEKGFTQVHHFKWDRSVIERLKDVAGLWQNYSYSKEYKTMYDNIEKYGFKINLEDFSEWTWKCENNFVSFGNWNKLTKQIVSI
jgi:hypothetical protein